jgi:hypothetical protein
VPLASPPGADLKDASSPDEHRDHGGSTRHARGRAIELGMTMGAEEVHYRIRWDWILLVDGETAVQA